MGVYSVQIWVMSVVLSFAASSCVQYLDPKRKSSAKPGSEETVLADIKINKEHFKLPGFAAELACGNDVVVKASRINETTAEFSGANLREGELCALDLYIDPGKSKAGFKYQWNSRAKDGAEIKGLAYSSEAAKLIKDKDKPTRLHLSVKLRQVFSEVSDDSRRQPDLTKVGYCSRYERDAQKCTEVTLPASKNVWIASLETTSGLAKTELTVMGAKGFLDEANQVISISDLAEEMAKADGSQRFRFYDERLTAKVSLENFLSRHSYDKQFAKGPGLTAKPASELVGIVVHGISELHVHGFFPVDEPTLIKQSNPRWLGIVKAKDKAASNKVADFVISGATKYFQTFSSSPIVNGDSIWNDFVSDLSDNNALANYTIYGLTDGLAKQDCKLDRGQYLTDLNTLADDELAGNPALPAVEGCGIANLTLGQYEVSAVSYNLYRWHRLYPDP